MRALLCIVAALAAAPAGAAVSAAVSPPSIVVNLRGRLRVRAHPQVVRELSERLARIRGDGRSRP